MLKIIRQRSETATAKIPVQGFALVRTSPKSKWTAMTLPVTIGSQTESDIVVNAPTMRGVSKIAAVDSNAIVLIDAQTQEISTLLDLKLFGIEMLGPFSENPVHMPSWRRSLHLGLNRENQLYRNRYPGFLRKYLPVDQSKRLAVMSAIIVGSFGLLAALPDSSDTVPDLSGSAIAAKHGNVVKLGIKSSGLSSSYAKGVTLAFSPAENVESKKLVLTMNVAGLDLANELSVQINGKFIGTTSAQLGCVDSYCALDYAVPAEILSPDGNTVRIAHSVAESSYEIKNIFFRTMEPATSEEIELVQQLLVSAERYYDERFLLVQNIRNAMDAVDEIERLVTTRTGIEALKPKFAVAKVKIQKSFQDISSDLQFKLQKELTLNHYKPAMSIVNDMLKLYPDPATRQNSMLMQQKKKLEEAIK